MLLLPLALAFAETGPILIREPVPAVKTLHAGDVTLQRPLLRRQRQTTGMTKPVLPGLQLQIDAVESHDTALVVDPELSDLDHSADPMTVCCLTR